MDLNKLLKNKDFLGALMSSLAPIAGQALNTALSGGLESGVGSGISNIGGAVGGAVGAVNPLLGGAITAGSGILGGTTNNLFGSKLNKSNINLIENQNTALNTMSVDNSSIDSIANLWQSTNWGTDFSQSFIGKDGLFSNKASNKYKRLKRELALSRERAYNLLASAAEDALFNLNLSSLSTFAAYGGPLGRLGYDDGAIGYELAKEDLGIKALNSMNKGRITSLPNSFGSELNMFANGGPEKNAIVSYAKLDTYYPFISKYPYTGHSSLNITDTIDGYRSNKTITNRFSNKGYNLLTNNCSDATREALEKTFNQKLNPFLFTTPGDVQDFALEKLHGVPEVKGDSIFIPNEGKYVLNTKELKSKRLRKGLSTVFIPVTQKQKETLTNIYKDNIYKNNLEKLLKYRNDNRMRKKAFGGDLLTHGAEWDNGVTIIGNGGTHENNPYEGVQMGVDNQGIPNLVEEGEVIFDDYVFSNRLNVPKAVRSKYKLRGNKDMTFADAAKQMSKESEERPNDPISKRGLEDSMLKLQQALEIVRQNMNNKKNKKGRKYEGGGELLRYAPVVGSALGLTQNLFSKPDYTYPDTILNASNDLLNFERVGHTPFGQYLTYKPLDTNYQTNQLLSLAGATRRAIMNSTSPSVWANLLALDYNTLIALGNLAREAEDYNFARALAVVLQNNQLRLANAEMGLRAAMANQEAQLKAGQARLSGLAQAMSMRDAIDARRDASLSSSLSNLFENLGNIGIDEYNRKSRDKYITSTGISYPTGEDYYPKEDLLQKEDKKQARAAAKRGRKITD